MNYSILFCYLPLKQYLYNVNYIYLLITYRRDFVYLFRDLCSLNIVPFGQLITIAHRKFKNLTHIYTKLKHSQTPYTKYVAYKLFVVTATKFILEKQKPKNQSNYQVKRSSIEISKRIQTKCHCFQYDKVEILDHEQRLYLHD